MLYHRLTPWLYLALPLVLLGLFFFWPLIQAGQMSLLNYSNDLYQPKFVGLQNYLTLAASPPFQQALFNTLVFVLGAVPAMMALPIGMALLINQPVAGVSLFRILIYLPVVVSMVVVGITWKWLLADEGLINFFLTTLHLQPIGWLTEFALVSIMLVVVWKGLAYYMMMYLANLQTLDKERYQAAAIDGANWWQTHWHVTLPHLRPTMTLVALVSTIGALKVFAEIYVMTRGGPLGSTQTLVYYIYERAFENLDLGLATAGGVILMGILLVISLLQLKYFQAGEAS